MQQRASKTKKKDLLQLSRNELIKLCNKENIARTSQDKKIDLVNKLLLNDTNKSDGNGTNKKPKLSLMMRRQYLIIGWVRQNLVNTNKIDENSYDSSLLSVIQLFYGMNIVFDSYNKKYAKCVKSNGRIIKRPRNVYTFKLNSNDRLALHRKAHSKMPSSPHHPIQILFGCSAGFNKGINKWKIKAIDKTWPGKYAESDRFGVTNKIKLCQKKNIIKLKEDTYNKHIFAFPICAAKGDKYEITLNCDKNTLQCSKNGILLNKCFNITENETYYPVILSITHSCAYKVIK